MLFIVFSFVFLDCFFDGNLQMFFVCDSVSFSNYPWFFLSLCIQVLFYWNHIFILLFLELSYQHQRLSRLSIDQLRLPIVLLIKIIWQQIGYSLSHWFDNKLGIYVDTDLIILSPAIIDSFVNEQFYSFLFFPLSMLVRTNLSGVMRKYNVSILFFNANVNYSFFPCYFCIQESLLLSCWCQNKTAMQQCKSNIMI